MVFLSRKKVNEWRENFSILMKKAFIYTDAYFDYDYGLTHPLKIIRLKLAYELIKAYGLLSLPSVQSYCRPEGGRGGFGPFSQPGISSRVETGE